MGEKTKKLIELINEGKTVNQISEELNLSQKQVFNYLTMIKNRGFDFYRKYYSNGDIIYEVKTKYEFINSMSTEILGDYTNSELKVVVISDTPLPFLAITIPLKSWTLSFDLPFLVSVMMHPTTTESPTLNSGKSFFI